MFELSMNISSQAQLGQNSLITVQYTYKLHFVSDTEVTHCYPYILTVNRVLHNHWISCNLMLALLHQHWVGVKQCSSVRKRMSDMHHNGDLEQVQLLQIMSPVKKLQVHTILHLLSLRSNKISSKFHTCDGKGWVSCKYGGTSCRFTGRFSSEGWSFLGGEEKRRLQVLDLKLCLGDIFVSQVPAH